MAAPDQHHAGPIGQLGHRIVHDRGCDDVAHLIHKVVAVGHRQLVGAAKQRFPERQIEVHRPGERHLPCRPCKSAPPGWVGIGGNGSVMEPPNGSPVQADLIDGLGRTNTAQFRGPIRGADQHRHVAQSGLDHCGQKIRSGGAAGADQHGGDAIDPCAERHERRCAFVVDDLDGHAPVGHERHRQRCTARPWRHDRVAQSCVHPFVDQGGAEGGGSTRNVVGAHRANDTRAMPRPHHGPQSTLTTARAPSAWGQVP